MKLPLLLECEDLPVAVVGAGKVGLRKARTLMEAGARVRVMDPVAEPPAWFRGEWRHEGFLPAHLEGVVLVVAATSDAGLNARICEEARARGILACNAGGKEGRVVSFMTSFRWNDLVVALGSEEGDVRKTITARRMLYDLLMGSPH